MRTKSPSQNIPNLDNLYEVTKDYVKEHQGEQGYINTDDGYCDPIYAVCYNFRTDNVTEHQVVGVRVNAEDDLQIMVEGESTWESVKHGDVVYYVHTLFSIAESIEEYD